MCGEGSPKQYNTVNMEKIKSAIGKYSPTRDPTRNSTGQSPRAIPHTSQGNRLLQAKNTERLAPIPAAKIRPSIMNEIQPNSTNVTPRGGWLQNSVINKNVPMDAVSRAPTVFSNRNHSV